MTGKTYSAPPDSLPRFQQKEKEKSIGKPEGTGKKESREEKRNGREKKRREERKKEKKEERSSLTKCNVSRSDH